MRKTNIRSKIAVGLLGVAFVAGHFATSKSLAAATTLMITPTQANVVTSTIPAVAFSGGADATAVSVPAGVTFSGGADATSDGAIPQPITFSSGTEQAIATIPDIIWDHGVDQVEASQTLTVNELPADNDTIIIGNCTVTFLDGAGTGDNSSFDGDRDCAVDGVAVIGNYTRVNPGVARTPEEIAERLRDLRNVSDDDHGSLTVSGSGADAIFTTAGTESVVGNIAFTDGTAGKITNVAVTSALGVAAWVEITIPSGMATNAPDHSVTIDGVAVDLGLYPYQRSAAQIADTLAQADFSSGTSYGDVAYTVSNPSGADVRFTKNYSGAESNAQPLSMADPNYTSINTDPAMASFTIANTFYGDYVGQTIDDQIIFDGVTINFGSVFQDASQIAATIAAADFASKDYTASANGSTITLTKGVGVLGGNSLAIQDPNYTSLGPVKAAGTVTIAIGLPASAPDHLLNIDGVAVELGVAQLDAAGVAEKIRTALTTDGGYGGKDYTVSGTGAEVVFIQKVGGVIGDSATPLTISNRDYTGDNSVVAVADNVVVPSGISAASLDRSVVIDGVTINFAAGDLTDEDIAAEIVGADFSAGTSYLADGAFSVSNTGAVLTFTRTVGGAGGNTTLALNGDYGAVAQVETITPANITAGETAKVTINGTEYSYVIQTGDTAALVVSGLQAAIANADVADSGTDTLILTANVPGVAFTVGNDLLDAPIVITEEAEEEVEYHKISGYVKDRDGLRPISGATVRVYTKRGVKKDSVKTDKNGHYSFKRLKEGRYVVKVVAAGYRNPKVAWRLTVARSIKLNKRIHVNLYMAKQ